MVVETKLWPTKERRLDTTSSPDVNRAAQSAQRHAGVVRWFLNGTTPDDVVMPTVMFWGSDLSSPEELVLTNREGVAIVHGRDSASWLKLARSYSHMDAAAIAAALGKLEPCSSGPTETAGRKATKRLESPAIAVVRSTEP